MALGVKAEFAEFKATKPLPAKGKMTAEEALKEIAQMLKTQETLTVNTLKRFKEEMGTFSKELNE